MTEGGWWNYEEIGMKKHQKRKVMGSRLRWTHPENERGEIDKESMDNRRE